MVSFANFIFLFSLNIQEGSKFSQFWENKTKTSGVYLKVGLSFRLWEESPKMPNRTE